MGASRSSQGYIHLTIEDTKSLAASVTIDLSYEQFALLITGMSIRAEAEWHNADKVGLRREVREVVLDITGSPRSYSPSGETAIRDLYEKTKEPGWVSDVYLGSQNSFFEKDGRKYARFPEYRWVPEKEEENDASA